MPKLKKEKKKSLRLKTIALITVLVLLTAGVIAQICFNLHISKTKMELDALRMGLLVKTAMDGLDEISTELGNESKIEELRLHLPNEDSEIGTIKYLVTEESKTVQISSRSVKSGPATQLLTQPDIESLFKVAETAQACSRGFTLSFEEQGEGLELSGAKTLADGRVLYIYREKLCNNEHIAGILESYLLRAESY